MLRSLALLSLVGLLVGCPPSAGSPPPSGDGGAPRYVLSHAPPPIIAMGHGEMAEVLVTLSDLDGAPVEGREVSFLLEGSFHDSGLMVLSARTDARGRASTFVHSGYTDALFRVRSAAEEAAPLLTLVSVSDSGFGDVAFTFEYEGARALERFGVEVYLDASCDDARVLEEEDGDVSLLLAAGQREGGLEQLPADATYAFVARGYDDGGVVVAARCLDGVALVADTTTPLTLSLDDLPFSVQGSYALTLTLSPSLAEASLSADAGEAAVGAALSLGAARYLLDALDAALLAAGEDDVAAALDAEAMAPQLQLALDADERGPALAAERAAVGLRAELAQVLLLGPLAVTPSAAADARLVFSPAALRLGPPEAPIERPLGEQEASASATASFEGATAAASFSLSLEEGLLVQAGLEAAAARAGAASPAAWLRGPLGVDTLLAFAPLGQLASECLVPGCVALASEATVAALLATFLEGAAEAAPTLVALEGTLTFADPDTARVTQSLTSELDEATVSGPALPARLWPASLAGGPLMPGALEALRGLRERALDEAQARLADANAAHADAARALADRRAALEALERQRAERAREATAAPAHASALALAQAHLAGLRADAATQRQGVADAEGALAAAADAQGAARRALEEARAQLELVDRLEARARAERARRAEARAEEALDELAAHPSRAPGA